MLVIQIITFLILCAATSAAFIVMVATESDRIMFVFVALVIVFGGCAIAYAVQAVELIK